MCTFKGLGNPNLMFAQSLAKFELNVQDPLHLKIWKGSQELASIRQSSIFQSNVLEPIGRGCCNKSCQSSGIAKIGLSPSPLWTQSWHTGGFDNKKCVNATLDWIKLDGIGWYWLVLNGTGWHSMVFDGIRWYSMLFDGIRWYLMLFDGIRWYLEVSNGIPWHPILFNGIGWYWMALVEICWDS